MAGEIKKLIDQYNKPPQGEVRRVRGTVQTIETMTGMVVLHLNGGASFALALEALGSEHHHPLPGDYVQGTTNPFAQPVNLFGDVHPQIFDFENISGAEREASFAFFRGMKPE
jgi:hypothetical protein